LNCSIPPSAFDPGLYPFDPGLWHGPVVITPPSAVPLPAGIWLMLSSLMGLFGLNFKRRKSALEV
jgi:hypothetical protein